MLLLGLLSAVLIAVAFRHLSTKASVLFCLLLILFFCFLAPWLLLSCRYCFHCLGCRAILHFSPLLLILATVFIAMPFSSLLSILSLFRQYGFSWLFVQGWTFLLLGCCFCSGFVIAMFILLLKTFSLWPHAPMSSKINNKL